MTWPTWWELLKTIGVLSVPLSLTTWAAYRLWVQRSLRNAVLTDAQLSVDLFVELQRLISQTEEQLGQHENVVRQVGFDAIDQGEAVPAKGAVKLARTFMSGYRAAALCTPLTPDVLEAFGKEGPLLIKFDDAMRAFVQTESRYRDYLTESLRCLQTAGETASPVACEHLDRARTTHKRLFELANMVIDRGTALVLACTKKGDRSGGDKSGKAKHPDFVQPVVALDQIESDGTRRPKRETSQ